MNPALARRPHFQAMPERLSIDRWLGIACGAAGLLASGLLFRGYANALASPALEALRQLGAPYLAIEVAVFLWARRCGFVPMRMVARAPGWARTALVLFLASFWISSVFVSQRPAFSTTLSLGIIVHLLFGGAVFHLAGMRTRPVRPVEVASGFAGGLALLAVLTAWHFLTPPAGLTVPWGMDGWGGAVPGFVSHRLFGSWCAVVAALLMGVAWCRTPGVRLPAWLWPGLLMAGTLLVWTGTRAAVLGIGMALLVALAMEWWPRARGFWPALLLVAAVAVPLGIALNPYGDPSFMLWRPAATLASADGASSGRLTLWAASLDVARHHPWLGTGAGSSWWLVELDGRYHVQPHNVVVQFLLNWGLVATLPALALIGWGVVAAHHATRVRRDRLPYLMALDCLLAMAFVDGMFHFAQFLMLIALFSALCLAQPTCRVVDL